MSDKPGVWHDFNVRPEQPGEYECELTFREAVRIVRAHWNSEAWEFTDAPICWYGMAGAACQIHHELLSLRRQIVHLRGVRRALAM